MDTKSRRTVINRVSWRNGSALASGASGCAFESHRDRFLFCFSFLGLAMQVFLFCFCRWLAYRKGAKLYDHLDVLRRGLQ
ncbi:hypothetical protein P170DRAFT_62458 [Aspergillus steynii IBT 23096]|uniref:Uncharacterized protein n=1 Tax=Aspergillus steynii IBT 23096 TaxID=1392250 RepID=A0A2I2FT24_9EURO|nr:uncharacterized protein P170DRAFT_62458 [Aspergillus steynii IBT 23096]PLB43793.1 hypothetical protein P170DRAFT_62458 [Aspergillus steynii IBT 23096]